MLPWPPFSLGSGTSAKSAVEEALFLEGVKEPVVAWQHADVALAEVLAPRRAVLGLVSRRRLLVGPNLGVDAEERLRGALWTMLAVWLPRGPVMRCWPLAQMSGA